MPRLQRFVLSKEVEPKFPDRCVASGKDRPGVCDLGNRP
jgi:hypothetical protein